MRNDLGAISKKLIAVLAIFTVFIYNMMPMAKVFANSEYVVTITFEDEYSGHADSNGSRIIINDAENHDIYTELRTSQNDNNSIIGNAACLSDGSRCTFTVLNGTPSFLSTGAPVFEEGGSPFNFDTSFTGNYNLVVKSNQNQNPNPPVDPGQPVAKHNVNFGTATWVVGTATVTATIQGKTINNSQSIEISDNEVITLTNYDSSTMDVKVQAEGGFSTYLRPAGDGTVRLTDLDPEVHLPNENLTFSIIERNNNQPGQPEQNEPVGGDENIGFDIQFTDTHVNMMINGVTIMDDGDGNLKNTFVGTVNQSGTTNSSETNVIKIQVCFGDYPLASLTINGVTYTEESTNISVDQEGSILVTVPGASSYTIRGTADTTAKVPRTIIWANVGAEANDEYPEDMILTHGAARVVEVKDEDGHVVNPDTYTGEHADEGGLDGEFGWVNIEPGNKVTFEFIPEYGYQLTSVKANGFDLEPQDTINQYEFTMPDANVHFSAVFTKTSDLVNAESEKVKSGSIKLGNNLDGGSAVLTVNDVELDSSKIKGFENAAKDYSVSTFLDIDLYNVFYKGKADADDVWSEKIDELEKEATITIKLENGVNGNDIVIVHNIQDGEEYEIIPTTYDPKTNTITFKTKSFSNYAIASRTVTNPKTGDKIMIYVSLLGLSIFGFIIISVLRKRKINVE